MDDLGPSVLAARGEQADPLEALRRLATPPSESATNLDVQGGMCSAPTAGAVWQALLQGEWSIVERYDADHRHYWIAVENDAATAASRRLTALERRVVDALAAGRAQKLTAFELGLPESSVSKLAATARAKLGLTHQAELVDLYTAVHPEG